MLAVSLLREKLEDVTERLVYLTRPKTRCEEQQVPENEECAGPIERYTFKTLAVQKMFATH